MIFSPPHLSNLQTTNIVWSNIKGKVGRKYTTQTTFKYVMTHLDPHTVQGCINQANQHLKDLHQKILDIKNDDEDRYSDKYVYKSNNYGNDNVNNDSSDGEANNYQKGEQQQGDQLGQSRYLCMEDSGCIW